MSGLVKRSLSIKGHRTSLALEPEFWAGLEAMAASRGIGIARAIGEIDAQRGEASLSSAVRVAVLAHFRDAGAPPVS